MPFGHCNAPITFKSAMNKMFKDTKNVLTYIDDTLVFNTSLEDHLSTLSKVFRILNENSVSINFEKSKFCCNKIELLEHEIFCEGIKPNITKIEKLNLKIHQTKNSTNGS
ncbi:Retrovirus-related Pol polyprotein from transposon 17.6 [Dictyocoela muelleri]|nr:Retrovirus-related Pol polyprotein from transposon 17.6 [Dictyocoela muelleri]